MYRYLKTAGGVTYLIPNYHYKVTILDLIDAINQVQLTRWVKKTQFEWSNELPYLDFLMDSVVIMLGS